MNLKVITLLGVVASICSNTTFASEIKAPISKTKSASLELINELPGAQIVVVERLSAKGSPKFSVICLAERHRSVEMHGVDIVGDPSLPARLTRLWIKDDNNDVHVANIEAAGQLRVEDLLQRPIATDIPDEVQRMLFYFH